MSETRGRIDWQEVHARLEQSRRALEGTDRVSPEEASRILHERARALARPVEAAVTPAESVELLVFSLGAERYAVETLHVLEVVRVQELTPVPGASPFILGVINHRGQVLAVLDLRRLFEAPEGAQPEQAVVVVLAVGGMTFGILVEAAAAVTRVGVQELAPPPVAAERGRGLIRGVTPAMVAVLDAEALARDPRITVHEEAS
jgi:purine-binding chemotaxis protein CheW